VGRQRLVVGITGASAPHLGIHLLRTLRRLGTVETHLVISQAAHRTIELETDMRPAEVAALADVVHRRGDIAAAIASGSFPTLGMAVVPCSMRTLAAVAHGYGDDLLTRAADVCLKERRPLVLVARETPLSLVHLRNMVAVTEAGATVLPPMPAFYQRPSSVDDVLAHLSGKVLDQFGIEHDVYPRWHGPVFPHSGGTVQPVEGAAS
jgi:polyprenyl P-hydroxybenzoate/phenylacrylic acid decarboxylase-like protein